MRYPAKPIATMAGLAVLIGSLCALPGAASASTSTAKDIAQGRALAFNRAKGNCLACHAIRGGISPGNIGPRLDNMKARFPHRETLFAQIWDPLHRHPNSVMPPFGANHILTKAQINKIIDFLYTL